MPPFASVSQLVIAVLVALVVALLVAAIIVGIALDRLADELPELEDPAAHLSPEGNVERLHPRENGA